MDVSPFSDFSYDNKDALDDFLLVNASAHTDYNAALEANGISVEDYPITDIGDTKDGQDDWLRAHYLMHLNLAAALGLPTLPDMTDVELHSNDQFDDWLQMHKQQHQLIDSILNL